MVMTCAEERYWKILDNGWRSGRSQRRFMDMLKKKSWSQMICLGDPWKDQEEVEERGLPDHLN